MSYGTLFYKNLLHEKVEAKNMLNLRRWGNVENNYFAYCIQWRSFIVSELQSNA